MKQKARSIIITVLATLFGLDIAGMLVSWLLAYLFPASQGIGAHTGGFSISIAGPLGTIRPIGAALWMAFAMFWEILWALTFGVILSAIGQAAVSKAGMSRVIPDHSPKSIAIACGLG